MKILHVCSEMFPLLKTGGLADVVGALPEALENLNTNNRVIVPGFPAFLKNHLKKDLITEFPEKFGIKNIKLYLVKIKSVKPLLYIIESPELYERDGNPYLDNNNEEYKDNYLRFALLGWIASQIANGLDSNWNPEIVHGHDWHAGLTFAYLKATEDYCGQKTVKSIFTVHNLAYQGLFSSDVYSQLELPDYFFNVYGLEFFGKISFLKSGLYFSDSITTVSPTYSKEIQNIEQGCGLNGLLYDRKNDLYGILNGVDSKVWNPVSDKVIEANYNKRSVLGKQKCKIALQKMLNLKVQKDKPIFGIVTRLTEQKGLHLVLEGVEDILKQGGQIVLLGSGDTVLEEKFKYYAEQYPESISIQIGYDEDQAHRIIAGSDIILVPSRFEPCGLTQLYGLIYGTLPLVHKVGGLADTVVDCSLENMADSIATGFVFDKFEYSEYLKAIKRAFALYERKADWKRVQKIAMKQETSWNNSAQKLLDIYKK